MPHRPAYLGETKQKEYFVYILANEKNNILYTGVTSNLKRRVQQHKSKNGGVFTKRYNVNKLVYYETLTDPQAAITRENQIKSGSRQKKIDLINSRNAAWHDLYDELLKSKGGFSK